MNASARAFVLGRGLVLSGHPSGEPGLDDLPAPFRSPVRRMDRYARTAYLAGCRAAIAGGLAPAPVPDPDTGVLLGTALGCRDSITTHAGLVRGAATADDLRPAVFAQTVHNTPCGELAIAWGLGGVSETLLSGRTAGLEAILTAAWKIEAGTARRLLAGGAEGVTDELRALWTERDAPGTGLFGSPPVEVAGILLLGDGAAAAEGRPLARVAGGGTFRQTASPEAAARLSELALSALGGGPDLLVLASPDPEGALARAVSARRTRDLASEVGEMLGAGGAVGVVLAVEEIEAGKAGTAAVVTRDASGATALLLLVRP
ncbi:MAG: hypothetical protein EDX89_18895 [Acidobacteria bacterium]|nr:MAG: hypothetical protein EDX89_18895 [Acidobacteriota bacterium]